MPPALYADARRWPDALRGNPARWSSRLQWASAHSQRGVGTVRRADQCCRPRRQRPACLGSRRAHYPGNERERRTAARRRHGTRRRVLRPQVREHAPRTARTANGSTPRRRMQRPATSQHWADDRVAAVSGGCPPACWFGCSPTWSLATCFRRHRRAGRSERRARVITPGSSGRSGGWGPRLCALTARPMRTTGSGPRWPWARLGRASGASGPWRGRRARSLSARGRSATGRGAARRRLTGRGGLSCPARARRGSQGASARYAGATP